MILQALNAYYQRRQNHPDPAQHLPAFGLEQKEIEFILELSPHGELKQIIDTRQQNGNRKMGTTRRVPQGVKKTSGIAANLLWDNAEYILALPDPKKLEAAQAKGKEDEYRARLLEMQTAFRDRIAALPPAALADAGIQAVLAFLANAPAAQAQRFEACADIASSNPLLTLRLIDDDGLLISERPGVAPHVLGGSISDDGEGDNLVTARAHCLVSGAPAPIERLHAAVKGVWGAQTSGANIVSFNLDAFNSYGKAQGANAPVGKAAAFAYTTALNSLLSRNSMQRMQVGDASTVFWAHEADPMESWLTALMGADDPDSQTRQVKALFEAVHSGQFSGSRGKNKFYVLGLAPNAARIAVRFWHSAPLEEIATHVAAWFDDLRLVRGPSDPEHPGLRSLLRAVVLQGKDDNIPPTLGGDVVRAIFNGTALPATWLNLAVQRCRAEQKVPYLRATVIKACLNRAFQCSAANSKTHQREVENMLDTENSSTAYRLGRLFAALEKIQEEASPGLNATIRDRYYGAASSTPVAVFTTLLRLKNHHLTKLPNKGRVVNFEKLLAEIIGGISGFPVHMSLQDQGRFAIGYYHQRQDFFDKREASSSNNKTESAFQGAQP